MNSSRQYKTNLRCGACIATLKPYLDQAPDVDRWEVDLASPDKVLTIEGKVAPEKVIELVSRAGYQVLGEIAEKTVPVVESHSADSPAAITYFPLLLLVAFLFVIVALIELRIGSFAWGRAMGNFMGSFFLAFSFFKLLDLKGFADNYRSYDVVARKFPLYGYVYPFIELILGIAYISAFQPFGTNLLTLVVMSVSSIGVIQSLLNKRKIRCACLGTIFNLPMSTVTLVEDGLMVCMAVLALLAGGH